MLKREFTNWEESQAHASLQVVQGRRFGMGQSKAHQWIHILWVVLQATLRSLGDAPTRSVTELAHRIGVAEAARYPSLTLVGSVGSESVALGDLFGGPAFAGQLAALCGAELRLPETTRLSFPCAFVSVPSPPLLESRRQTWLAVK